MTTISQRELRNDNATIVRRVEAGETFVVTRRGVPVADLVPHDPSGRVDLVFSPSVEVVLALATGGAEPDIGAWLRDSRAADDLVEDDDRDPWTAGG